MTLIGAVIDRDHAWCFADTEGFRREKITGRLAHSTGHQMKIAFNERTAVAAAGAGDVGGNKWIAEAVAFADLFDEFCFGLPRLLKEWAYDRLEVTDGVWPDWISIGVGYSHKFRCIMGATCNAADKFSARLTGKSFLTPHVAAPELANLASPDDLVPIAQRQMAILKRCNPLAGAGTLTIAEVRRDAVSTSAFDIPSGARLAALPDIPEMRAGYVPICDASCVGGGKQRADGGGGSAVGANS